MILISAKSKPHLLMLYTNISWFPKLNPFPYWNPHNPYDIIARHSNGDDYSFGVMLVRWWFATRKTTGFIYWKQYKDNKITKISMILSWIQTKWLFLQQKHHKVMGYNALLSIHWMATTNSLNNDLIRNLSVCIWSCIKPLCIWNFFWWKIQL